MDEFVTLDSDSASIWYWKLFYNHEKECTCFLENFNGYD